MEGGGVVGPWRETFGLRSRAGKPEPGCVGCQMPGRKKLQGHVVTAGRRGWEHGWGSALVVLGEDLGGLLQPVRKWRNEKNRNNNRILLLTVFNSVWFSIYRPWGSVNNIYITHDAAYCKHAVKIFCSSEWHPITSGVCTPRSGYWRAETLGWGRRNVLLESCPWFLNSNGVSFAPLLHVFLVAHSLPKLTRAASRWRQ